MMNTVALAPSQGIRELSDAEIEAVSGGMDGWDFAASVMTIGVGVIAVTTAPLWGAVGGLLTIGAVGARALAIYSKSDLEARKL